MKYIISIIGLFVLSSCLKKMNYTEELNTSLYDSTYSGEKWFEYINYKWVGDPNDLNTIFRFQLKEKILPWSVKAISVVIELPGYPTKIVNAPEKGKFGYIIFNPKESIEYCFTVSIYTADTNKVIKYLHPYTDCITYE